jgi:hypothetical protein
MSISHFLDEKRSSRPGVWHAIWREHVFAWMMRTLSAAGFFSLPTRSPILARRWSCNFVWIDPDVM